MLRAGCRRGIRRGGGDGTGLKMSRRDRVRRAGERPLGLTDPAKGHLETDARMIHPETLRFDGERIETSAKRGSRWATGGQGAHGEAGEGDPQDEDQQGVSPAPSAWHGAVLTRSIMRSQPILPGLHPVSTRADTSPRAVHEERFVSRIARRSILPDSYILAPRTVACEPIWSKDPQSGHSREGGDQPGRCYCEGGRMPRSHPAWRPS
jgi:hypothetical protein